VFEDEDSIAKAAEQCDDCTCWVEYCEGECCSIFQFRLTPRSDVVYLEELVRIHTPLTDDVRRYYELHGAVVEGEVVIVPRESCELADDLLIVRMQCREQRPDHLCGLHASGTKPDVCSEFTPETALDEEWGMTPRCLYQYKLEPKGQDGPR
jgi:hypothetical protein